MCFPFLPLYSTGNRWFTNEKTGSSSYLTRLMGALALAVSQADSAWANALLTHYQKQFTFSTYCLGDNPLLSMVIRGIVPSRKGEMD